MLDFENPAAPSAIGIGHMPIARAGVDGSKYQLLAKQSVGDEELEGYNIWKSNGEGLLF
jgi:hypothetical protein